MSTIARFVAALERRAASKPWFFDIYAFPYRALVARELRLAEVSADDTVIHIGCGSLPFTAVLTAQLSGARVIGVDCDADAVEKARAVVARLGLREQVSIVEADAADDGLPAADVVLVALQARPKAAIYRNIARNAEAGPGRRAVRVVFRLPRPGLESEYGTLTPSAPPARAVGHRMPTFDRSELHLVDRSRYVA